MFAHEWERTFLNTRSDTPEVSLALLQSKENVFEADFYIETFLTVEFNAA